MFNEENSDLPKGLAQEKVEKKVEESVELISTLAELEQQHILRALAIYEGNKTKAAQALGVTIKTLYNKIHQYGLKDSYIRPSKKTEEGN